jgi:5-methylcytosine-specific restriction endonuclease McrA
MNRALQRLVWQRAKGTCEYCRLPQALSSIPFEIDHIISEKHRGPTVADNLALSCFYCNSYKGPNISGIDPRTGKIVSLFHPRRQRWQRHFRWDGPYLVGRTAAGRATIEVLEINHPDAVRARQALIDEGLPPGTAP